MAASTRLRTTSDNAASGGQGGGAVGVNTLQRPGYSPEWRTLLATTTFLSQRAEPSPLWLEIFPKRLIRRGTTRISRVLCDKARRGWLRPFRPRAARRRAASEGEMVVGATPEFWPLMRHGAGAGYSGLYSSFSPASWGRSHHRDPWREGRNAENPEPGCPAQPGLIRARSPYWTWCGQPTSLAR